MIEKSFFFLKCSLFMLVIVILIIISAPEAVGITNIENNYGKSNLFGEEVNSGTNNLLTSLKKGRNFANNPREAVEWSNQYFPDGPTKAVDSEDLQKIQNANNELRTKYLNRSELYENQDFLNLLDQSFLTVLPESVVLYANFTSKDFGISRNEFNKYPHSIFYNYLYSSSFGIDHGYFLGSLTPKPFDSEKNEVIQIKLEVPKGTEVIRVGALNDPQFILKREQTLKYLNQSIQLSINTGASIMVSAELSTNDEFEKNIEDQKNKIKNSVENQYDTADNFELMPLGLNASLVLDTSLEIIDLAFESLNDGELLSKNLFDKSEVIFTNGWFYHTDIYDERTRDMNLAERRDYFNLHFSESTLGETGPREDGSSVIVINISRVQLIHEKREHLINEEFASTLLHELCHHFIRTTGAFKDHLMFTNDNTFIDAIAELRNQEVTPLMNLLLSPYANTNPEEFICEAFAAKFYPSPRVASLFPKELPRTNRFLNNLFDDITPSIPLNVKELEVDGHSATVTFNHSTDNISIARYNLYKDGILEQTHETMKDANGLSYADPGNHESDLELTLDDLEQYTEYNIQVSSVDEAGNESEKSSVLKVKTKDIDPPKLLGDMSGGILSGLLACFHWSRPTDNVEVSEIRIRRNAIQSNLLIINMHDILQSEETFTLSGDSTYFNDFTIEEGKTYTYSMTALDAAGNESKRSNEIVLNSSEDDDERRNEDRGENTTSSHSTLNWSGVFEAGSFFGFQIFSWSQGPLGWIFGGTTFVSGSELSALVNLNPGMLNLFQVVPIDEAENPLDNGLLISVESFDHSSLTTKDSTLYAGEKWELGDNFVSSTDEDNQSVSWEDSRVTSNGASIDISKPGVYTLKYQFNGLVKATESIFNVRVKENHSSIKTRDSTLYVGEKWDIEDNFGSATDEEGQEVPWGDSRITVDEASVDTSKPGVFTFTYYFNGKGKTLNSTVNLTVKEDRSSVAIKDSTVYVGEKWEAKNNFVSATDEEGKVVPWGDPRITTNGASVDTSKPGVYSLTYSFKGKVKKSDATLNVTVKEDHSSLTTKDSTVYVRRNWEGKNNFVNATDEDGKVVLWEDSRITTNEASVDTSKPGVHTLTYSFKGKVKRTNSTLKVTVKELMPPKNLKASEIGMTNVLLNWDVEEDTFQEEAKYEIYQDGILIQTVSEPQLPYKVENLQSAHEYSFTVKKRIGTEVSKSSGALTTQTKSLPLNEIIKSFTFDSSGVLVTFDRASFEANNRMVLVKNGVYIGETYNNKVYYSSIVSRQNNVVTVRFKLPLLSTDRLELQLHSGRPGGAVGNTVLEKKAFLPLDSPKNLKVSEIGINGVTLTWEAGGNSSLEETKYEIYQDGQRIQTLDNNQLTIKVANLQTARSYAFTVKAKVGIQESVSSNECTVQTKSLSLQDMVKEIKDARVTLDRTSFEGKNRIVFMKNGIYEGETYNNKTHYSSVVERTETTITIDFKTPIVPTDQLELQLRSGVPGGGNTVLERKNLPNTATYTLSFHTNHNGTGNSRTSGVPIGMYESNIANVGNMLNDAISSVWLPPRSTVILYEHSNYGGRSKVLFNPADTQQFFRLNNEETWGPIHDIYRFDKLTSSYKFYNHTEKFDFALWTDYFGGGAGYFGTASNAGEFSRLNTDSIGREFSDTISSVVLPPRSMITLYEHINFSGRSQVLSNPNNTVSIFHLGPQGYKFNDITSSFKFNYLN